MHHTQDGFVFHLLDDGRVRIELQQLPLSTPPGVVAKTTLSVEKVGELLCALTGIERPDVVVTHMAEEPPAEVTEGEPTTPEEFARFVPDEPPASEPPKRKRKK